jgi:single-strand DNA-binding protein
MNVFTFTGKLPRDAEVRELASGQTVTQFTVPVDCGFGEKKTTAWVNCSWWSARGAKVAPYLTKGQLVAVTGEFQLREYDAKDGTKKSAPECRVSEVSLLGGKPDAQAAPKATPTAAPVVGFDDSDVPF